jgi:hypothetical protein
MKYKIIVDRKPIACRECSFLMDEGRYSTEITFDGYVCRIEDKRVKNIHNTLPGWCPLEVEGEK